MSKNEPPIFYNILYHISNENDWCLSRFKEGNDNENDWWHFDSHGQRPPSDNDGSDGGYYYELSFVAFARPV
jgi:hypothetical protein